MGTHALALVIARNVPLCVCCNGSGPASHVCQDGDGAIMPDTLMANISPAFDLLLNSM